MCLLDESISRRKCTGIAMAMAFSDIVVYSRTDKTRMNSYV